MGVQRGNPLKKLNVLALTKYDRLGASSRLRFFQYLPWLQRADVNVTVQSLLSEDALRTRYQNTDYDFWSLVRAYATRCQALLQRHHFNLMWIEKEALQWFPLWFELAMMRGTPYVLDFDDAVFHRYDQHPNFWLRRLYSHRLDGLMAKATLVVSGNNYLAQRARDAGCRRVVVLPTVIDLDRYTLRHTYQIKTVQRVVWIGSPSTVHYLQLLREPLQILAQRHSFVLRVIGGGVLVFPGVQLETVEWSENTEVESISACEIGLMPLLDSSWEQGKCGYKLIQYMACGLPVVASNVGVNAEIVEDGENGFLASTPEEWVDALSKLLGNMSMSSEMGQAGRRKVERSYCIQKTGPMLVELLRSASDRH